MKKENHPSVPSFSEGGDFKKTRYLSTLSVRLNRIRYNLSFSVGVLLLALFVLAAVFAGLLAPYDPFGQELLFGLNGPDSAHWMGRDQLGRDMLSRILYGSRVSLLVGFITIAVSGFFGIIIGGIAGAFGGKIDGFIMRVIDIVMAFPGILLAISIMSVLGPGLSNVILALCLTGWVGFARITRGQILSLREREYVVAATAAGASEGRLIFFHYLPNAAAPLIIEAAFGMAAVIVAEAGLSFLGLGIQPPAPSWGTMLNEGRSFLLIAPHLTAFPGLCLALLVLAINLAGDGLRDILDVRS
jgi:peptide/nickel transport system permease protein